MLVDLLFMLQSYEKMSILEERTRKVAKEEAKNLILATKNAKMRQKRLIF